MSDSKTREDSKPSESTGTKLIGLLASQGALGALLLHAAGYLSLRHQLDALAIETSLPIVDERYLFEGARAVVHMLVTLPQVVLILLVPLLLAYATYRRWAALRRWTEQFIATVAQSRRRLILVGLAISAASVEFIMRQPLQLADLLLKEMPNVSWLQALILDDSGAILGAYFGGLLIVSGISVMLLVAAWQSPNDGPVSTFGVGLLTAIVAVQVMLLPINYGILTAGREAPRVSLPEVSSIDSSQQAWLVWESQKELVVLTRKPESRQLRLVSLPADKAGQKETLCIDRLLHVIHGGIASRCDS